jgi:hypothetical protein
MSPFWGGLLLLFKKSQQASKSSQTGKRLTNLVTLNLMAGYHPKKVE